MPKRKNLVGLKFNYLTVIEFDAPKNGKNYWFCRCSCGKVVSVSITALNKGQESCGCVHNKRFGESNTKHGMSRTYEYKSWAAIKIRCYNKNSKAYKDYGGRGITMSDEWVNDFMQFYKDMGARPNGYSIERIDNNKGYCKENCKWASTKEQSTNKRWSIKIEFNGKKIPLNEWCRIKNFNYVTILSKLKKGIDVSNIKSIKKRNKIEVSVEEINSLLNSGKSVHEISKILNIPEGSINYRLRRYIRNIKTSYW